MDTMRRHHPSARYLLRCALVVSLVFTVQGTAAAGTVQKTFGTPEAAVQALLKSLNQGSRKGILEILGPDSTTLVYSGDAMQDKEGSTKFLELYAEKNSLEAAGSKKVVLHVGNDDWPFPIPIVKSGARWRFDSKEGARELLSRRIGKNELGAIQACLAIADAEKEYASRAIAGNGLPEYAGKFVSTQGKKDGLYWDEVPGEDPSPLGPYIAHARSEGYGKGEKPTPYHGYLYRILTEQGSKARGGAYSYVIKGRMVGGFAIVAYPAKYLGTGVKTFMVNHDGIVYQKDLGSKTVKLAKAMKAFNPDGTWEKAQ